VTKIKLRGAIGWFIGIIVMAILLIVMAVWLSVGGGMLTSKGRELYRQIFSDQ
jgi:hypothetical protein